jgi:hypothetical protein
MKTLAAVILALGIGFVAAYVVVSNQKPAALPHVESAPAPTLASTESQFAVRAVPAAAKTESPQEILSDLLDMRMGAPGGERNAALREVVFKLECLAHSGSDAVPAIRQFIGRGVDVNYNPQDNNQVGNPTGNGGGFGSFRGARRARDLQNLQTDWIVPPSLRLGLVGTLKEIGGPDAEQALAEMLASTTRGIEVAYLTVVLEKLAPGKYRDDAIKAAKNLLTHPVAMDSPDRLDDLSKSYLYGVLEFYGDTSFAPTAKGLLVGANGRLDQDAMDYLSTVLKDQSVSALCAAYNDPALTNQFDKMRLDRNILNFVGQNAQANQLFADTVDDPNVDSRAKIFSIIQLAGGFGDGDNLNDLQLVNSRIGLLSSLLQQAQIAGDPILNRAITQTIEALQNGDTVNPRDLFTGNDGGGSGVWRNRGGANGKNAGAGN